MSHFLGYTEDYELDVNALGEDQLQEALAEIRFLRARIAAMKEKGYLRVRAAAAVMGQRGGIKGGRARARLLSPERRREIAVKAAQTRWAKLRVITPNNCEDGIRNLVVKYTQL